MRQEDHNREASATPLDRATAAGRPARHWTTLQQTDSGHSGSNGSLEAALPIPAIAPGPAPTTADKGRTIPEVCGQVDLPHRRELLYEGSSRSEEGEA